MTLKVCMESCVADFTSQSLSNVVKTLILHKVLLTDTSVGGNCKAVA